MVTPAQGRLIDAMLSPARIGTEIDSAIAAKVQDTQKSQGAAVLKLLDGDSQAGDPLVAKATGVGGLLDVVG